MHDFKPGDYVEYTGDTTSNMVGSIGVVIDSDYMSDGGALTEYNVPVQWFGMLRCDDRHESKCWGVFPKSITKLPTP